MAVDSFFHNEIKVTFTPAQGNTDISFYEAGYFHQACVVKSDVHEKHCTIRGLAAGGEYRIYAQACMATQECSHSPWPLLAIVEGAW